MSRRRGGPAGSATQKAVLGLGLFSLALGAAEIAAPGALSRAVGLGRRGLVRSYGVREAAAGIGILAARGPAAQEPWLWARVAGDALDIATLLTALRAGAPRRPAAGLALGAVLGVTLLDVICARRLGADRKRGARPRPDYGGRSGFPRPAEEMRGAASDFVVPDDMREPKAMRFAAARS